MSTLEDFLEMSDVSEITDTIKVKVGGKVYELKIRALSEEEHSDFQKRALNIGKKGNVQFDKGKYDSLVIPTCIVEPNFRNAEFLQKAKCQTAWDFLTKKFPSGVLVDISAKIQELSGFESLEEEVENAKN